MTKTTRRTSLTACALVLIAVVVLLFLRGCESAVTAGTGAGDAGGAVQVVRIEGDLAGTISPGVVVPLDLRFTNPHDVGLSITGLTVVVRGVVAPGSCAVDDFEVDQAPADLRVTLAARATNTLSGLGFPSTTWPRLGMRDLPVDQDGCKGASLTLDYTASGTRGDR
ncbi:hypothetical protein [Umezawaea sp. Da 62-37]|uniref:hypothetical protein n=1 Tax=Umezawaea sp. Da 62-37 TaxID=3075927 RepID=UPI0028F72E53|nr:hypothetical protein [Umezawaea sp. Da 62-37]WNV86087.1 hypothetical protein RM788_49580 [Umezawaea sp. Da 62-37]